MNVMLLIEHKYQLKTKPTHDSMPSFSQSKIALEI